MSWEVSKFLLLHATWNGKSNNQIDEYNNWGMEQRHNDPQGLFSVIVIEKTKMYSLNSGYFMQPNWCSILFIKIDETPHIIYLIRCTNGMHQLVVVVPCLGIMSFLPVCLLQLSKKKIRLIIQYFSLSLSLQIKRKYNKS